LASARAIDYCDEGFFRATVRLLAHASSLPLRWSSWCRSGLELYEQFIKLSQSLNYDTMIAAARVDDPARLSDTIAANLQLPVDEKQTCSKRPTRSSAYANLRHSRDRTRKAERRSHNSIPA